MTENEKNGNITLKFTNLFQFYFNALLESCQQHNYCYRYEFPRLQMFGNFDKTPEMHLDGYLC